MPKEELELRIKRLQNNITSLEQEIDQQASFSIAYFSSVCVMLTGTLVAAVVLGRRRTRLQQKIVDMDLLHESKMQKCRIAFDRSIVKIRTVQANKLSMLLNPVALKLLSEDSCLSESLTHCKDALSQCDIKEIEIRVGVKFDPEIHEAVASTSSSMHSVGDVTQICRTGYSIQGKILRPAQVTVSM